MRELHCRLNNARSLEISFRVIARRTLFRRRWKREFDCQSSLVYSIPLGAARQPVDLSLSALAH